MIPGIDQLPVVRWELAEQRKRIPEDLQRAIGAPTPFLRVSHSIDDKQRTKHHKYVDLYLNLSRVLVDWESLTVQSDTPGARLWRVFTWASPSAERSAVLIMTVIGEDTSGSFNLVSMHARKQSFLERLQLEGRLLIR